MSASGGAAKPVGQERILPAAPGRGLLFAGLAYSLGVLIVGTNLPAPLYAVYRQQFHFSPLTITLIVSAYVGVLVPTLLLCGSLADAVGLRAVLVPAVVAAAAGALVFATAAGTGQLFAARIVQGLAVGAASGPLTAALVRTEPAGNRARASLLGAFTTTAGAGIGPVLSGVLAQYAPAPLALCFVIEIGLLVPALAAVAALGPPERRAARWRPLRVHVPAAVRGRFAIAGAVSFLAWAVVYIVLALVPSYVIASMHSRNLLLGGVAAGLLLLCAAVTQPLCRDWRPERAQSTGLLLLMLGLAGLIAAGELASIGLLLATLAVTGVGQGLAFMGALRRVNEIAPAGSHAAVASAFYVVTYLGGGGPVVLVGLAATRIGLVMAVQVAAVALAACCLGTLVALMNSTD